MIVVRQDDCPLATQDVNNLPDIFQRSEEELTSELEPRDDNSKPFS